MPRVVGREDDLGAKSAHELHALGGGALGHDQLDLVAARRRDHGERDAGVAAGRLDEPHAGLEQPALLGPEDHAQCGTILDAAAGIVALELAEQANRNWRESETNGVLPIRSDMVWNDEVTGQA